MVGKANLIVSYVSLLSAWIVGFAFARFWNWRFPLLAFNPHTTLELIWFGLVVLVFCIMFFGRLQFLFFLALGAIQAGDATSALLLLYFFRALVLVWFGMVGVLIGEKLFEDLEDTKRFDLLEKQIATLFVVGVILAIVVAVFSSALESAGEGLVDLGKKIRNHEISLNSILEIFKPQDLNAATNQNIGGAVP